MSHLKPKNPTAEDEKRGYAVTVEEIKGKNIPMLHCLKCQFDVLAPEDEDPKQPLSGMRRMFLHLKKGRHPWGFEVEPEEVTSAS